MLLHHQLDKSLDILLGNQRGIWRNAELLIKYLLTEQIELLYNQTNKKGVIFIFDPTVNLLNLKRAMLQYGFHCSCFISFPSVHTSLFVFHLIFFSPHFILHISFHFLQSTVHLIHFIYHIFHLNWLHTYCMVIQSYCQFPFSANPISGS